MKIHARYYMLLVILLLCLTGCGSSSSSSVQQTPTNSLANLNSTQDRVVLGGIVKDFTTKFGNPTSDSDPAVIMHYQPYNDVMSTNRFDVSLTKGKDHTYHAYEITFNAPPNSPVNWQDAVSLCQSFLPADAVHLSDTDFSSGSSPIPDYQQIYMSKSLAHEFSADNFVEGRRGGKFVTPGTVQIMYYTEGTASDKSVTLCYVSLGQPY